MTVVATPGHVRLRSFQVGKETTFGTPVAATRRMSGRFTPTVNPNWTNPDVDTGTIDPAQAPYRTGIDLTGQYVGPATFNDCVNLYAPLLKGGVTPTGGPAYVWDFQPASTSADAYEILTAEWGDEVTGDEWQFGSGIVDQLQIAFPQDLGPAVMTADWRFANYTYPHTITGALAVEPAPAYIYAADTTLYIDNAAGSIGDSPLTNSLHDASITIAANTDVKRFMNGSNTRFNLSGYGRGARTLESTFTLAKTTASLIEFANFLNAAPTERFVSLDTTSAAFVTGTTPYVHRIRFAGYWYTRTESTVNGNSVAQLVCRHIYDPAVTGGPIRVMVTNGKSGIAIA